MILLLITPPFCFLILLWLFMAHASVQIAINAGRLSEFAKWAGYYPITLVGVLWDVAVNQVWGTLLLWDWRFSEWTLTQRIERLQHNDGWRGKVARWLRNELNAILPGHVR